MFVRDLALATTTEIEPAVVVQQLLQRKASRALQVLAEGPAKLRSAFVEESERHRDVEATVLLILSAIHVPRLTRRRRGQVKLAPRQVERCVVGTWVRLQPALAPGVFECEPQARNIATRARPQSRGVCRASAELFPEDLELPHAEVDVEAPGVLVPPLHHYADVASGLRPALHRFLGIPILRKLQHPCTRGAVLHLTEGPAGVRSHLDCPRGRPRNCPPMELQPGDFMSFAEVDLHPSLMLARRCKPLRARIVVHKLRRRSSVALPARRCRSARRNRYRFALLAQHRRRPCRGHDRRAVDNAMEGAANEQRGGSDLHHLRQRLPRQLPALAQPPAQRRAVGAVEQSGRQEQPPARHGILVVGLGRAVQEQLQIVGALRAANLFATEGTIRVGGRRSSLSHNLRRVQHAI
mmetsp:Transcript_127159/g.406543  ORF Transcript_127159/g.406543 Transcript_127159/m.406543 type:complete len:410 (+) Transcript_127159:1475-2704(+)